MASAGNVSIKSIQQIVNMLINLFQMSNNVENLSPQIIRGVVKEMQDLVNNPPEGIKVQINEEDVTDIQAYIDGPAGRLNSFYHVYYYPLLYT